MTQNEKIKLAYHVSGVSIGVNTLLSIGKILSGVIAQSGAMISDGIHSASDVISTFIVIVGIKLSSQKEDKEHEYGHEKIECLAGLLLGAVLFMTGLFLGYQGLEKIFTSSEETLAIPGILALVAALISIIVKESMFWYTRSAAKKTGSSALMADAWHHRSDALSSIAAFIGILGARMGFVLLDPIASMVVCLFIAKAAYDIIKDATDKLVDKACPRDMENKMRDTISEVEGVCGIETLRTRLFGNRIYVDVEVLADEIISFSESHKVAEAVHEAIKKEYPDVKNCMVHISPVTVKHEVLVIS